MNWLYYLLEANLYLCLFYAGYQLLFSRETYYTANRAYLLASCIMAFIIPFLQLGFLKPVEQITQAAFISKPVMVTTALVTTPVSDAAGALHITWQDGITAVYLLGLMVSLVLFGIKIYKITRLISNNPKATAGTYTVVYLNENNTAFSFFNYLFIGKNIPGADVITRHELVHIKQKHSVDIIFLELIKVINWFNPLVYLLQNSLKSLHEYIADAHTASADNNPLGYSTFLLNNAHGMEALAPANSFFNYNLLKKRIIMLNQQPSGSLARLKYLLIVPLCAGMVCASTVAFSKTYSFDLLPQTPEFQQQPTAKSTAPQSPAPALSPVQVSKKTLKTAAVTKKKVLPKVTPAASPASPEVTPEPAVAPKQADTNKLVTAFEKMQPSQKVASVQYVPRRNSGFEKLSSYLGKKVHYPARAYDNKTTGGVNIAFYLNDEGKVTDAKLASEMPDGCAEEALRVVNDFNETIAAKAGHYVITVDFLIKDENNENVGTAKPAPPVNLSESAGGAVIYAYPRAK